MAWERTFCSWVDTTPEILRWSSEETVVPYFDPVSKKNRKYYVDFRIVTRSPAGAIVVTLIEIKPHKQTIKPRANKNKSEKTSFDEMTTYVTNMAKWQAAKAYCTSMGWSFKLLTEKDLFSNIDEPYKPRKKI